MFFVFNSIGLIMCMTWSIIFGFALRRDLLAFERDAEGVASLVMRVVVFGLAGLLAWVQLSVLFDMMLDMNAENIASFKILLAFPLFSMFITWVVSRHLH